LDVLKIFFAAKGSTRWTVLVLLLLAGFAEGIGLTTLLPVLTIAVDPSDQGSSMASKLVFDTLDRLGLSSNLETLLLIVLGGILLKAFLRILAMRHVGYAAAEVAAGLRTSLIENLLQVKWSYFTRQPVGRMANAVSLEATHAARAYIIAVQLMATAIQCVVYIGVAVLLSWKLALLAIGIGGVIALTLGSLVTNAKKAGRRQTKRARELVVHLSDTLVSIKSLKAMAREKQFAHLLSTKIADLRQALRKQVLNRQLLSNLQEPMLTTFLVAGFYLAFTHWSIPLTELLVMGILLRRTATRIGKLQTLLQNGAILQSAYWSIHNLVKESESEREPLRGSVKPTLNRHLALHDVSFAYGSAPVLQNLSMDIPAHKMTLIVGASGAGKTTVTDLLLGLYQLDEGEILIDDVSLDRIDLQAWRGMVGYVPQDLILFHDTVLANVTLGDQSLSEDKARAALEKADAWEFVSAMPDGMMTTVGERGISLSGGQRQRIALARALIHDPSFLILDEVTSGLDSETEQAICRNMKKLTESLTILALSHSPAWLDVADQVFELNPESIEPTEQPETQVNAL
jgi:ATP-binding cassette subfamily C protein